MEDRRIIELFADRDETALHELSGKYGGACRNIAAKILGSEEDAKEVFNDAMLNLWNAIPPACPDDLFKYLCTVVRRLSLQRLEKRRAQKRGGGRQALSLDDENVMQVPAAETVEAVLNESMTVDAVNRFLETVSYDARTIFIQRYGNGRSVREIAALYHISQSKVLVSLMRTRNRLKIWLKEEGWL
ncbi:MAG: sigma-70 family RNA polymerase sigma factor [Oscillospiraceae bacterium]|nr:sigma-70 family RNA polymerase sigma factor [Oscillospiraceae bacterium]